MKYPYDEWLDQTWKTKYKEMIKKVKEARARFYKPQQNNKNEIALDKNNPVCI